MSTLRTQPDLRIPAARLAPPRGFRSFVRSIQQQVHKREGVRLPYETAFKLCYLSIIHQRVEKLMEDEVRKIVPKKRRRRARRAA